MSQLMMRSHPFVGSTREVSDVIVEYRGIDYGVPRRLAIHPDRVEIREACGARRVVNAMWVRGIEKVSLRKVAGIPFLYVNDTEGRQLCMPMRDQRDALAAKDTLDALVAETAPGLRDGANILVVGPRGP